MDENFFKAIDEVHKRKFLPKWVLMKVDYMYFDEDFLKTVINDFSSNLSFYLLRHFVIHDAELL